MNRCPLCGDSHEFKCPYIKAYEYYPEPDRNGNAVVKRVEFVTFADFHKQEKQPTIPAGTTSH